MAELQLIGHGAQAKVYKVNKENSVTVIKQRLPKKYRHPDLDKKINQSRIKSQAKIMKKLATKGIRVPKLLQINEEKHLLEMEYINGPKLKDSINNPQISENELKELLQKIGLMVSRVHEAGIIHGDLTTSNMLLNQHGEIVLIDFGLSYFKDSAEDKAVDMYVLERAFKSTHPHLENKFDILLIAYGNQAALKKLQVVRQRGRKKVAFG